MRIKTYNQFNTVNELNTTTYVDIINKTESYPWVRFLSDKELSKADKMQSINILAKELFTKEFLKEFNTGLEINNGGDIYTFEGIKFNTNYTNYSLIFEGSEKTLLIKYDPNGGYYLGSTVEDNLDNESKDLLNDMLKYMKR